MNNMLRHAHSSLRTLFSVLIVGSVLLTAGIALAQEEPTAPTQPNPPVVFPIEELGSCESKVACRAYCEIAANREACVAWGEAHGLMKPQEAQKARQILKIKGPGGCTNPKECRAYCEEEANRSECMDFAKNNNLISPAEQKVHELIASGEGPGGCDSPEACRAYCENVNHREECRKFATDNQLPPPKIMRTSDERGSAEANRPNMEMRKERIGSSTPPVQLRGKIQEILAENPGPGGCTTVDECKTFCADSANSEACIAFARTHELMGGKEADRAAQVAREVGPGGCRGIECKEYCADEAHAEECLTFAQSRGIMSPDQVRGARTFLLEGGPGGCKGPEECRSYCEDSAHVDECQAFAQTHGLMEQREERIPGEKNDRPQIQVERPLPQKPMAPPQVNTEEGCTKAGGTWNDNRCSLPTLPAISPEERCAKVGGSWDGTACIGAKAPLSRPNPINATTSMGAPPTGPRPEGTMPPRPQDLEERCIAVGGTWEGNRCSVPPRRLPPPGASNAMPIRVEGPASIAPYSPFAAAVASLFVPFFR